MSAFLGSLGFSTPGFLLVGVVEKSWGSRDGGNVSSSLRGRFFLITGSWVFLLSSFFGPICAYTEMGSISWLLLVLVSMGMVVCAWCQISSSEAITAVYIVTLKQAPGVHAYGELKKETNVFRHGGSGKSNRMDKARYFLASLVDAGCEGILLIPLKNGRDQTGSWFIYLLPFFGNSYYNG